MKVSVIIPTYKRLRFLARAINSVLFQSHDSIEIIVVDDNGLGTRGQRAVEDMLESRFGNVDHLIYLKNEKNMGSAASRNYGAEKASGDYLCFLDDDDAFLTNKIEDQLFFMEKNKLDISFSDVDVRDGYGKVVAKRRHSRYVKNTDNVSLLRCHLVYHLTPTVSFMFRKNAFFQCGGFKGGMALQTYLLTLEAIERNLKIGYFPEVTAIQYVHKDLRASRALEYLENGKELYQIKEKYFDRLSKAEINLIKLQFDALTGVCFAKKKLPFKAVRCYIIAFFRSPVYFCWEILSMMRRAKGA